LAFLFEVKEHISDDFVSNTASYIYNCIFYPISFHTFNGK